MNTRLLLLCSSLNFTLLRNIVTISVVQDIVVAVVSTTIILIIRELFSRYIFQKSGK